MNPEPAHSDQPAADESIQHVAGQTFLPGSPLPMGSMPPASEPSEVVPVAPVDEPAAPAATVIPLAEAAPSGQAQAHEVSEPISVPAPQPEAPVPPAPVSELAPAPAPVLPVSEPVVVAPTMITPTVPSPTPATGGSTVIMPGAGRPRPRGLAPAIIGIALILVVGGGAAYGYAIGPKTALRDYLVTIASAKTAKFSILTSSSSPDFETSATTTGSYDIKDLNAPKVDVAFKGTYTPKGSAAAESSIKGGALGGEVMYVDKTIYVKLDSSDLLKQFLNLDVSTDWYKYSVADQKATVDKCVTTNSKKTSTLFGGQILTDLPLKNLKRHGLFELVAGHLTQHFSGELDLDKLQTVIDKANKDLSSDCQISFKASDLSSETYTYDVWRGWGFDRLKLVIRENKTGNSVTNTLDTSAYNKPVTITAPTGAKSLEDLINSIFNGTSTGDTGTATLDTVASRDTQRKTDLRVVRSSLEIYFNDKGAYPSGNYAGLSKILVPNYLATLPPDPTSGGSGYLYLPSACKKTACSHYELRATMEDTKDSQITIPPAIYSVTSLN